MIAKITKINYPKVTVEKDGKSKEYEVMPFVLESFIKLGINEITIKDDKISFIKLEQTGESPKAFIPSEPKNNIIDIKGKSYMTYEGLLKKAHEKGEFSMEILNEVISDDMTKAWVKIRLTAGGQIFDGIGSSTPENTGKMTSDHPVEMAHTRAKGRAFRDYLNIGEVMAEELK